MADLRLEVSIKEINVQKASYAFLRKHPIPMVLSDPDDLDSSLVPEFAGARLWVEEWLRRKLLYSINKGIRLQSTDIAIALSKSIFIGG